MARLLSWLVFVALMTVILAGSLVVIVGLYLPFVVAKAIVLMAMGRVKPRFLQTDAERARMNQAPAEPSGPVPF